MREAFLARKESSKILIGLKQAREFMATHSKEESDALALKGLTALFGAERAASMMTEGLAPMWKLIGIAVGLAVISVVAGLSILASGTSAGLISATTEIVDFLPLIGLGIAVGLMTAAFQVFSSRRR